MKNPMFKLMKEENINFGETTLLNNPIFKVMNEFDNSISDSTGMQNPMMNSNMKNLGDETGMGNPIFRKMRGIQNLDDMLNEMSEVMINLQQDITKVMTEINQLNLLITNIKNYRAKNNMQLINNNMMENNMLNNNINNINNMINNNMMNNNINDINNMINNNMMNLNNIIPPMIEFNMNNNPPDKNYYNLNIVFRKNGKTFLVNCKENEIISNLIKKYREKANDYEDNLCFIYNAKDLNQYNTVAEAGLVNNANILVLKK